MTPAQPMDSLAQRWQRLKPHAARYGRPGGGPLVILFHGCGGVQDHLRLYGERVAEAGGEAVVIDSYAPRGWGRAFGLAFVCTGAVLRGAERAGDVLAAAHGLMAEGDPDRPLILAGWSHGGWSIMDLMTMVLDRPGEAGLADPSPAPLSTLQALFLAYPYGGIGALSRVRPWLRSPDIQAIAPRLDHVTNLRDARRLYAAPRAAGCRVELWEPTARHSFDEPSGVTPWRRDDALGRESLDWFSRCLDRARSHPDTRADLA